MRFGRTRPCALMLLAFTLQAADPLADVFTHMDAAAARFKGMTADISETVHIEIVDDNNTSTGTIKLKRGKPGDVRFLVDFLKPSPRSAAYAGTEIHVYNPKTNTEQIYDVSTKKAVIEQAILLGFGATSAELKSVYTVTFAGAEAIDGKPTAHIRLIPKSKEMLAQVKEADLWISDTLGVPLRQKFLTSSTGNYNLFQYSNLKLENSLSDKDLQLKTPKDAKKQHVGAGSPK